MTTYTLTIRLPDTAEQHGALGLIAPIGLSFEEARFVSLEPPEGWSCSVTSDHRTGQLALMCVPPKGDAPATFHHRFAAAGGLLTDQIFQPDGSAKSRAAEELAGSAQALAQGAGGGIAGIQAIVDDANVRFDYGEVPVEDLWYYGEAAVPMVGCAVGTCIDINTFLIASLRSAGYEAGYVTCYFVDHDPAGITAGMHCWIRTRHKGVVQNWDIAHVKKRGGGPVIDELNPIPGHRFALAYGHDHVYPWNGLDIHVPIPSRPLWVLPDGSTVWGEGPEVTLA